MVNWSLAPQPQDYVGNIFGQYQQGRQQAAGRDAAMGLAAGDYTRAQNAFAAVGDSQGVLGVQDRQRGIAREGMQDQRQAAADQRTQATFEQQQRLWQLEDTERKFSKARGVAQSLLTVQDPSQRAALFQSQGVPALREMGVPEEEIARVLQDGVLSDDEVQQFIVQTGGVLKQAQREKGIVLAAGSQLRDPTTGALLAENTRPPEYLQVDPTKNLYEVGGAGGPAMSSDQIAQAVTQAIPGARMTSGQRSEADNNRVGGVPNSYHLSGQAADFVPPQGVTIAQLEQQIRQALPGMEIINEGDHIHVEPAGRGGPRLLAAGQADNRQTVTQERQLRREFEALPDVKAYRDVQTSAATIRQIAGKPNPTAQDDLSLIFAYMKLLDPGSVVREGEFANAQNTAGIPDRIRNAYNNARDGRRLNARQRQEFSNTALQVLEVRQRRYDELSTNYQRMAAQDGLNPENVILPASANNAPAATGGPAAPSRAAPRPNRPPLSEIFR